MNTLPIAHNNTLPALPCGWTLKQGFLTDPDKYQRHVLDDRGRVDRLKVATILSNNELKEHAACWKHGTEERDWRTLSVCEVCAENSSVAEYVAALEGRLAALGTERDSWRNLARGAIASALQP